MIHFFPLYMIIGVSNLRPVDPFYPAYGSGFSIRGLFPGSTVEKEVIAAVAPMAAVVVIVWARLKAAHTELSSIKMPSGSRMVPTPGVDTCCRTTRNRLSHTFPLRWTQHKKTHFSSSGPRRTAFMLHNAALKHVHSCFDTAAVEEYALQAYSLLLAADSYSLPYFPALCPT